MKILQINTTVNSGSTGRIAEDIGRAAIILGSQSYIAAAYTQRPSESNIIKIGSDFDRKLHGVKSRLFDRHGFGSAQSTKELVSRIREISPDIIHLHNIHGYYLHIRILFDFLKEVQLPVVWTFHDCWPFTGHCSHFENIGCEKWKTLCHNCPKKGAYPASWGIDNSKNNFTDKKKIFNELENLHIVAPSNWLASMVQSSFLKNYPTHVIHNGIDIGIFKPNKSELIKARLGFNGKQVILGVANVWQASKGLGDIILLSKLLSKNQIIVLVGATKHQIARLPPNIIGISRTENISTLVDIYSNSDVFINPTYSDNFPTTNIEALACGTPVITYNTGGSPEAIDQQTGFVVEKGDIKMLNEKIQFILREGKNHYFANCRQRAEQLFNKNDRNGDYLKLYESLLKGNGEW
jgi:glycosyltransferase involved in cell wall biosynthesis